jgi:hypothetical protein
MGVLYWIRSLLSQEAFLTSHTFAVGFTTVSKIAQAIATKHPLQRPHVFDILKRALDVRPPADSSGLIGGAYLSDTRLAELSEAVIDVMVDLMSRGYVIPVLDHFNKQSQTLDLALLRKFMMGVFEVSDPPYSKIFRDKFVQLLESSPGRKAGIGGGNTFQDLKAKFLAAPVRSD